MYLLDTIAAKKTKWQISILKIIACGISVIILHGCLPCYYAPNAQNVPLFKEKMQFNTSAAFKVGMYTIGTDIQSAFAATDHLGIMANYSYFTGRESSFDWNDNEYSTTFRSNMLELGLGYFQTFEDKFVFEVYSGYGSDNIHTEYDRYDTKGQSTLHHSSFFFQPAVGFYKSNVELAFSTRFRILNYDWIDLDYEVEGDVKNTLLELKNDPVCTALEPAFTFRAGGENIKFQFQVGLSFIMNQTEYYDYDPLNLNFGVIFSVKGKKKD